MADQRTVEFRTAIKALLVSLVLGGKVATETSNVPGISRNVLESILKLCILYDEEKHWDWQNGQSSMLSGTAEP